MRRLALSCRSLQDVALGLFFVATTATGAAGALVVGPGTFVEADGAPIEVPGYSVPSLADWNNDGLPDLIVGEGSGTYEPHVRVYLNVGAPAAPSFDGYFYVQADGGDLTVPGSGCLGLFPRVVHWDADGRKDLLVGRSDGRIMIFLNVATDEAPAFDAGTVLEFGPAEFKVEISVIARATPSCVDYDDDGRKDLVSGSYDGRVYVFINEGTDEEPDFVELTFAECAAGDLDMLTGRSSPHLIDVTGDGLLDIVAGDTAGQLLLCVNEGMPSEPFFAEPVPVCSMGTPIDLPGSARSRPFVGDVNEDGLLDVLIGSGDGRVLLYEGVHVEGDANNDGTVDIVDLLILLGHWGNCTTNCDADFNDDGIIDVGDLLILLANWG
jgi:hypothetical protein